MNRHLRALMTLMFSALLSGCATTYQRVGFSGGYSETQLGENVFRVSFRGNGYTSDERTSDFALLRAAEVATQHGFAYFVVVDSEKGSSLSTYTTPSTSQTSGSAYGYGNYAYGSAQTTTYGGQTFLISKPRANNTILCFKEKPDINGLVFEAAFVAKSIRERYRLHE